MLESFRMDRYKETFETWNKVAELYNIKFMDLDLYNESYDAICNSINKINAKILEIGCGPGNITSYLVKKRPDFDILGIDISPNMIALAKQNVPNAEFQIMDSRNIHNLKTSFDGIVCGFCLPYLSMNEVKQFIQNSYSLLNDNGLLYISFVQGNPKNSGFQTGSSGLRVYFNYHETETIYDHLSKNNFIDIKLLNVNYKKNDNVVEVHTIITARKTI